MGKALIAFAANGGGSIASGSEINFFGSGSNATESATQYSATEGADFTALRAVIIAGNSGTATVRFRDGGVNGNNVVSLAGTGTVEDTTPHTDTLTAADLFNLACTDTGTNPQFSTVSCNVTFASGHGCFHGTALYSTSVWDVASATRYSGFAGTLGTDGTATVANAQWKNRGYTSVEAIQLNVTANARVNNTVFSLNVNGSDTGSTITYAAAETGIKTVTGMGVSLSAGDLICISCTTGTGVEDMSIAIIGVTLKSTSGASEAFTQSFGGSARTASATASYYTPGGQLVATATEANARIRPGFAARCSNLRCYLSANTYTGAATLKLMVNGVAQITTTIGASGGAGWYENTSDIFDIDSNDEISLEIDEGTANSITIHSIGVTLDDIPPLAIAADAGSYTITGTAAGLERGRVVAADGGSYAINGATVSLQKGQTIAADGGSYAVTGTDATLNRTRVIDAAAGSYAINGTTVGLEQGRVVAADGGSYAITGQDVTLEIASNKTIAADAGAYAITGTDAALEFDRQVTADAGSYAITGTDVSLVYLAAKTLDAEGGSYVITGSAVDLAYLPVASTDERPITYGGGDHDYEMRVRAWWGRIDVLRRENAEREAAETGRKRAIEARQQALAELEAQRSRKRTKAAQRAREAERAAILADIAEAERESEMLRTEIAAVVAEILRVQAEIAAAEQAMLAYLARRNAALALLLVSV